MSDYIRAIKDEIALKEWILKHNPDSWLDSWELTLLRTMLSKVEPKTPLHLLH